VQGIEAPRRTRLPRGILPRLPPGRALPPIALTHFFNKNSQQSLVHESFTLPSTLSLSTTNSKKFCQQIFYIHFASHQPTPPSFVNKYFPYPPPGSTTTNQPRKFTPKPSQVWNYVTTLPTRNCHSQQTLANSRNRNRNGRKSLPSNPPNSQTFYNQPTKTKNATNPHPLTPTVQTPIRPIRQERNPKELPLNPLCASSYKARKRLKASKAKPPPIAKPRPKFGKSAHRTS